ncbi:hypothetical protein B0T16DRAFT_354242 [Cercophora newfieldiana]|uniref:Uncharacterized protein n=1 Tax=Cercophora newfieldiana TaxID=92897 RepID=A0AA39XZF5_9PEZI|nr:hypothetical protein B0T16DRAFT_354242 [Cercophora newfieldiana]
MSHAATASPLPSPTPSNYLTLAEQTFTPLSMDGSDFGFSDTADDDDNEQGRAKGKLEKAGLLRATRSQKHWRMSAGNFFGRGHGGANASTAPVQVAATPAATTARASGVVSAVVQSFEALRSPRAENGYDLISTKDNGVVANGQRFRNPPDPGLSAAAAAQHRHENDRSRPQRASDPTSNNDNGAKPPSDAADSLPPTVGIVPLIRPTPANSPPQSPRFAEPSEPSIVRTSSAASLNLKHPTPDPNKRSRSGACLGNIAALEATAERLSMTSSIEAAIREEHEELKRSDSRRSSILRANSASRDRKISVSDAGSVRGQALLSAISRQSSIVELNTAARLGGYSPAGYVMSPHPSLSGAPGRLRSGSKTGSIEVPPVPEHTDFAGPSALSEDVGNGEDFPFLSRHGAGKVSTRSTRSNLSYVQSAGIDEPTGLNKEAFDEADRRASVGGDLEDDETIRASAYQHIEEQFAHVNDDYGHPNVLDPMLDQNFDNLPSPRLQIHQPESHHLYQNDVYSVSNDDRPTTSGSGATYQQAQTAFGDFDGVHCVPEIHDFPPPPEPRLPEPELPREPVNPHKAAAQRPKSYFDPSTGQQMLFYPARVPAMLNLPPKLSKKPKAAAQQMRRSQLVVDAMADASRESRIWLPDPMDGLRGSRDNLPFMTDYIGDSLGAPPNLDHAPPRPGVQGDDHAPLRPTHSRQASETSTIHPSAGQTAGVPPTTELEAGREIRRPQRLTDTAEKRNTRATLLEGLPPQLRASAFFDLPASVAPKVEIKGGSAMATLDSILDASASAPVSAFTDHVFAGKLGSEVYGTEKKKKKAANGRKSHTMTKSTSDLLEPPSSKKKGSHFSLLGGRRKHLGDDSDEEWTTVGLDEDRTKRPDRDPHSPNDLAPDADERSDKDRKGESDEEEEDEEELYQGPPTTLLAELQLRKQQNKMRTRNITQAYPNGMHSTLLELDAVAEVQRKARHGKRVNLAWEDPNANPDHNEDLDDDEVPLGMLYVAKASGMNRATMDISAVMSEIHRPLGLMERRELEENEPLSRRRERLQGNQNGLIPPTLDVMHQRLSQLHPSPYGALGLRSQSRLALPLPSSRAGSVAGDATPVADADEEGDFDGETLAQRKARLAAENPLPRARPVSGMFSAELLSQFGGDDERPMSVDSKGKAKVMDGKENTPPSTTADEVPEEEETLGQRRRRLQAEREARDREFATAVPASAPLAPIGINTIRPVMDDNRTSRRLSLANVLNAHPREGPQGMIDPREAERLKREAELIRVQQENDAKMAALRAQMPTSLPTANIGARNGGYMNGMFNDGLGGTLGAGGAGMGYAGPAMVAQQQRMSMMPPAGAYGAGMGYAPPVGGLPYGGGMPMNAHMNPAGMPYGAYGAPMPVNAQGTDMVERWRQGVMP